MLLGIAFLIIHALCRHRWINKLPHAANLFYNAPAIEAAELFYGTAYGFNHLAAAAAVFTAV